MDKAGIREVALYRFAEQGYHATTMKQLADDLGVTSAAFYYHFKSKDELLASLVEEIMLTDLETMRMIQRAEHGGMLDRLIYSLVYGTCHAREEAIVVARETVRLERSFRRRVVRMFHEFEQGFAELIAAEYDLAGEDLTLATRAVMGLALSVLQWFHAGGPLSEHEVALTYTGYARGILERAERDAGGVASGPKRRGEEGDTSTVYYGDIAAVVHQKAAARRTSRNGAVAADRTAALSASPR